MFNKQQFLDSMAHEAVLCKHLFSSLPEEGLDYCPGKNMRSTMELLKYLCRCSYAAAWAMINDKWDAVAEQLAVADDMAPDQFPERMDQSIDQLRDLLSDISEEELETRSVKLPWGTEMKLGEALVATSLKFATAYRMQLFLYAKAAGGSQLNTYDCWLGIHPEEK